MLLKIMVGVYHWKSIGKIYHCRLYLDHAYVRIQFVYIYVLHDLFYVFLWSMHDLLAFIHFLAAIFTTTVHCFKKGSWQHMLTIRVLSSLSPSRFPHYHLFHRPHPQSSIATGTRVAGTAVPNGPGAAFQPPGNWEEEVLGAWIHVAWLWPHCRYVNLGHRYSAMALTGKGCQAVRLLPVVL